MTRPHIEWIQAQLLEWRDGRRPGTTEKILSIDTATGACSLILRYPPGFSRGPEQLAVDEEFWVLDGTVVVDGTEYHRHTYAHLPRGMSRSGMTAPGGAVVLTFFSGAPAPLLNRTDAFDADRLVRRIDAAENVWDGDLAAMGLESMQDRARIRTLRRDPCMGEITYLTATSAFRRGERSERHPVVQEFYLLSGELAGDRGTMHAGAYCWRPPEVKHAPYGSWTGALILFRAVGGPQTTTWEDADAPFTWTPPHRPVLPPNLAPLMAQPWTPPDRF